MNFIITTVRITERTSVAKKPVSGKSWDCVHETDTCYMGFPHLYYPSNPAFARHFVEAAAQYEKQDARGK